MALIDRDDAIKAATCWTLNPESELMYALKTGIRSLIEKVPAIDAVEVVFCKDCEYCNPLYFDPHGNYAGDGSFTCGENETDYYAPDYHMDTFYCADGKRRETDVRED